MSVNKAIIIGHLGKEPEMRYTPSGEAVANISVATTDKWTDKASGEKKEATEWHRVSFFGKLAEVVGQYLRKGSQVYIEGRLQTRKWTDKDGIERYTTGIAADSMRMLSGHREQVGGDDKGAATAVGRSAFNGGGGGRAYTRGGLSAGPDDSAFNGGGGVDPEDIPF